MISLELVLLHHKRPLCDITRASSITSLQGDVTGGRLVMSPEGVTRVCSICHKGLVYDVIRGRCMMSLEGAV